MSSYKNTATRVIIEIPILLISSLGKYFLNLLAKPFGMIKNNEILYIFKNMPLTRKVHIIINSSTLWLNFPSANPFCNKYRMEVERKELELAIKW